MERLLLWRLENIYSQTLSLSSWWKRTMQPYFGTMNHQRLVTLTSYFVYIHRELYAYIVSGTVEYQKSRVGYSKSIFSNIVHIFSMYRFQSFVFGTFSWTVVLNISSIIWFFFFKHSSQRVWLPWSVFCFIYFLSFLLFFFISSFSFGYFPAFSMSLIKFTLRYICFWVPCKFYLNFWTDVVLSLVSFLN